MTDFTYAYSILARLDGWLEQLARPIVPPRLIALDDRTTRLEFTEHLPHTVMIGKLVRIASGIHAAFMLSQSGFVTESGAILRIVSDLCTEVGAIGHALDRGGDLPKSVATFVEQYFTPKERTPEDYAAAERTRYVSREDLIKSDIAVGAGSTVDVERTRALKRFLNMGGDAYVHGAYETTMELCDPQTGRFYISGHPAGEMRAVHLEFAALKLHEVVIAFELTAAVTSVSSVFEAARNTRRDMDQREPWKLASPPA